MIDRKMRDVKRPRKCHQGPPGNAKTIWIGKSRT